MSSVTNVPVTPTALLNKGVAEAPEIQLPKLYLAARQAIEACASIDECKEWADKSAALRAYAVMRDDVALTSYAQRIHLRSVRRIGLLLKQIPRADESTRYGQEGTLPPVTRTSVATEAGLSEHQRKTALRVASIPGSDFEAATSDRVVPPTVTRLAEQGTAVRGIPAGTVSVRTLGAYSKACETLAQFAQFCERNEPIDSAHLVHAEDVETVCRCVAVADQWLDQFVANLPGEAVT